MLQAYLQKQEGLLGFVDRTCVGSSDLTFERCSTRAVTMPVVETTAPGDVWVKGQIPFANANKKTFQNEAVASCFTKALAQLCLEESIPISASDASITGFGMSQMSGGAGEDDKSLGVMYAVKNP